VLRPLSGIFQSADYPDLLVGLNPPDDAAVWRLDKTRALVLTTDFFTPVVDDAYDYGVIAAANSLSDVYAMGGQPFMALNIAGLPPDLPADLLSEILRGAADKAKEAGVVIAGGHTIQDKEPKFGLVVVGMIHPAHMLTKGRLHAGDHLVLTKPLGIGVTTTALKRQQAEPEDVAEAVSWMTRLNREAGQLAVELGLRAGTDITGYSLIGHSWEMAQASEVGLRFDYPRIPFLSCARRYAEAWTFPGGAADNHLYYSEHVHFAPGLDEAARMLLFDPQTSGGLLLAVPPRKLTAFQARATELQQPIWDIGEVTRGDHIEVA
jgi:selenide,water dikinase